MDKLQRVVHSRREASFLIEEFYRNYSSTGNPPNLIIQNVLIDRLEKLGEMELFLNKCRLCFRKSEDYAAID